MRFPVPAQLRLFWDRVTFSRITTIYFIFSVLHCLIQVIFQVQAFTINAKAVSFLSSIIAQGNATVPGFAILGGPDLHWCTTVPDTADISSCPVIWSGKGANNAVLPGTQNAAMGFNSSLYPSISSASASSSVSSLAVSASLSVPPSASSVPAVSSSASLSVSTPTSLSATSSPTTTLPATSSTVSALSSSVASSSVTSSTTTASSVTSHSTSSVTISASSALSTAGGSSSAMSSQSQATSLSSTAVFTVTIAPSAFSRVQSGSAESSSVTRTLTVVLAVPPTQSASVGDVEDKDENVHKSKRDEQVVGALSSAGTKEVQVDNFNGNTQITLDDTCLLALTWPDSQVKNTKREDIVFICFQIWVLGMSIVALLNESIPHIFASLLTHVLATAWGGFQIANTKQFHADFVRLTTNGACGVNLLPTYWKERANAEIPSLVLNCVALLVSAFLTWRLIKLFGWQTFKRVGASLTINRVYNAVLVLSIVIQLSSFFIIVSGGLWLDQVFNGDIGRLTGRATVFKAVMVLVLVLLIPWLATGWIAVRRELRIPMLVFLLFSFLYLVGWSAMFVSNTFRWTFLQWRFFSLIATASVLLTTVTFILGIVCRVNFGKGLRRHLEAQELLEDDVSVGSPDFEKGGFEKVEFPSINAPIPTFSAAFGSGPEVPPPSQMRFAPHSIGGPRSYGPPPTEPYSSLLATSPSNPTYPSSEKSLSRHESGSSQHSITSTSSSSSSGHSSHSKRWIIE